MNQCPANEWELRMARLASPLPNADKDAIIEGTKRVASGEDVHEVFQELFPDVITDEVVTEFKEKHGTA